MLLGQRALRRERVFRDRRNPLELSEPDIVAQYRLSWESIMMLCDLLNDELRRETERSKALSVQTQLFCTLRFLATGSFQQVVADLHGVSKASVSRSVHNVCLALCHHAREFISFPSGSAEIRKTKENFFLLSGLPNTLGVIDGTLFPIKGPSIDKHFNVCRKGYHAMNVQAVCDTKLKFVDVVVRYPGSTHDAYIWKNCAVADRFERRELDGWLVGDSAYGLRPWMMTPLTMPITGAQMRFNTSQMRNTIERSFGVLKMRFRCLSKTGTSPCHSGTSTMDCMHRGHMAQ